MRKTKILLQSRFLFVIRKEQDFSVITSFHVTAARVGLMAFLFFVVVFGVSFALSRTLLASWFDPASKYSESTTALMKLTDTVDSLMAEVAKKDVYLMNIQRIISGDAEEAYVPDSTEYSDGESPESRFYEPSEATLEIIQQMRGMPLDNNFLPGPESGFLGQVYFFPPIKGLVTATFDPAKDHFGVDVVAKENEPVKSIADGTVMFGSWTLSTGYVIGVQHSNDLVSIYKHNSVILKNVGETVRGGEVISIIGNTGELTTGTHLHVEIWYKGSPLNPQDFISFD